MPLCLCTKGTYRITFFVSDEVPVQCPCGQPQSYEGLVFAGENVGKQSMRRIRDILPVNGSIGKILATTSQLLSRVGRFSEFHRHKHKGKL